jgi:para-aminobenzoate synthetase component 1
MLELYDAEGAFERLQEYLEDERFFDGDAVAHVYLGYGLSDPLRRTSLPAPPEPCRLPLLACDIDHGGRGYRLSDFEIGTWERSWTDAEYREAIRAVQAAIARGDVYQVNLVQHLSASFSGDPHRLAAQLDSRLGGLHFPLVGEDWAIVSASPELFLERRGRTIRTMPIKGTRPLGAGAELEASPKDAAEHTMIVDLERNDLARVCEPGSVRWPRLRERRAMAGVEHLVSTVEGTLREDATLPDILAATFPGGSVTGAPKIAALDEIARHEPVGRGASMGALGAIWPDGYFNLSLTIRTFAIADDRIHLWVGGGIVADSDPAAEVEESWVKARPLLEAIA